MTKEFLPQGDNIRQLLVKSNISNTKINLLLKEKGVFLGHSEKNNSIPLLMKSIISPNDFDYLYSTQKTKEDRIKYRTASIKCNTNFNVKSIFKIDFNLNESIKENHTYKPNFKIMGNPNIYFEDENTAILEYKIERENLLNDWTNNKSYHKGSVVIKKINDKNIQVRIQQNSTSKETIEVNNIIISQIKQVLRNNSIINNQDDFITIKFNNFDNPNRIKFLNSFMANFCKHLDFKSITDIDLNLDQNVNSHNDIKPFLDEIENLKLNGKKIQNHILLSNELYHPKLIFSAIKYKYKLDYYGIEGITTLYLSFPEYIKNQTLNSELQISIDLTLSKEDRSSKNENKIRKELLNYIEKKKIESFNKYKLLPINRTMSGLQDPAISPMLNYI